MDASDNAQNELNSEAGLATTLDFDQSVDHLSAAYSNSQSVVRFLDTKAAAVIGVVPIILGVVAAIFKWAHEVDAESHHSDAAGYPILAVLVFVALALILIGFATAAVATAITVLLPRDTGDSKPSILFPYESPKFKARLQRFTTVPAKADVIEDYRLQIDRMSEIVKQKLDRTKKSISQVRTLLIASGVCVAATILFGGYRALPPNDSCTIQDIQTPSQSNTESVPLIKSLD